MQAEQPLLIVSQTVGCRNGYGLSFRLKSYPSRGVKSKTPKLSRLYRLAERPMEGGTSLAIREVRKSPAVDELALESQPGFAMQRLPGTQRVEQAQVLSPPRGGRTSIL